MVSVSLFRVECVFCYQHSVRYFGQVESVVSGEPVNCGTGFRVNCHILIVSREERNVRNVGWQYLRPPPYNTLASGLTVALSAGRK